jgi:integrase
MEAAALERKWLDKEEEAIRFPDTKSGARPRVIGRAAIDLLLDQPKTKSPFFFPADWGGWHFIGVVRVLDRACQKAWLADSAPHTLRHTFAILAGDLGVCEFTIAALLGHSVRGITQRYIHIDEALRMTADRVSSEMADLLDGRAPPARARVSRGDHAERHLETAGS